MISPKPNKKRSKQNVTAPRIDKADVSTAEDFIRKLQSRKSPEDQKKNERYFRKDTNPKNKTLGVRMKFIFDTAREFDQLSAKEIEKLLDSPYYEVRMGGVSIMDFKARDRKITEDEKKILFDLYINKHSRIDNWDLVDRSAPYVVGGYLNDKPREKLYKLAKSKNVWERRTSIVSTYYFIRKGDVTETFKIAELLVNDEHDLIQKAVGSWIRHAGGHDKKLLKTFLEKYASSMPRTMLSNAIDKFSKKEKDFYLEMNSKQEARSNMKLGT